MNSLDIAINIRSAVDECTVVSAAKDYPKARVVPTEHEPAAHADEPAREDDINCGVSSRQDSCSLKFESALRPR